MLEELIKELKFRTSRSGGAGGQHVNKVSTKVELLFHVPESRFLTEEQKSVLLNKLKNRISGAGLLTLSCEETRSQMKNKEIVIKRFLALVEASLKPEKPRKPTKPTKASQEKRLSRKKKKSEKKDMRKKPE